MLEQRDVRFAKDVHADVPHLRNLLCKRGAATHACICADNATDMSPMSHKPHPSNKGLQTAWPEDLEKFVTLMVHTQNKWFCL